MYEKVILNNNSIKYNHYTTGQLDRVTNLKRVLTSYDPISFTWERPFSLNITNFEPDILFCVSICSLSCSTAAADFNSNRVAQNCNVSLTEYELSEPDQDRLYRIEVYSIFNLLPLEASSNGTNIEVHEGLVNSLLYLT